MAASSSTPDFDDRRLLVLPSTLARAVLGLALACGVLSLAAPAGPTVSVEATHPFETLADCTDHDGDGFSECTGDCDDTTRRSIPEPRRSATGSMMTATVRSTREATSMATASVSATTAARLSPTRTNRTSISTQSA